MKEAYSKSFPFYGQHLLIDQAPRDILVELGFRTVRHVFSQPA